MKPSLLLSLTFVLLSLAVAQPPNPPQSLAPAGAIQPPEILQTVEKKPPEPVIQLGQPVDEVKAVLEANKIYVSDLPFPFPAGEKTHSFLGFTLDLDHINAQVFYANATKRVTSIAIQVRATTDKSSEGWVSAQSIRFNADRTFDIRFLPPREPAYKTMPEIPHPAESFLAERRAAALICIGQDIAAAEKILQAKKIDYGSGRRAIALLNKDADEYSYDIDGQHCGGAIYFSKSTKKITGLDAIFVPTRDQGHKINQAHLDLQAVRFNPDGSYELRFSAPLTHEERAVRDEKLRQRKHVYPTSEDTGPRPLNFGK